MKKKILTIILGISLIFSYSNIALAEEGEVIETATETDLGYTSEVTDEGIDNNWNYYCEENIAITGTKDEINISPAGTEYNVQPGDGGSTTINFSNNSENEYEFKSIEHNDSKIKNYYVEYYGNDFNSTICNYLKGTSRAEASPVTKWIEQNKVEGEYNPNSRKFRDYISPENVLEAYNSINNTEFTNLEEAWNYNFFNKCWNLTYDKEWENLNYTDGDALTITWSTDGYNTDNAYMNTVWSWGDLVTINKKVEEEPIIITPITPINPVIIEEDPTEEDPTVEEEEEVITVDPIEEPELIREPVEEEEIDLSTPEFEIIGETHASNIPETGDDSYYIYIISVMLALLSFAIFVFRVK